jgi:hypothetical protein
MNISDAIGVAVYVESVNEKARNMERVANRAACVAFHTNAALGASRTVCQKASEDARHAAIREWNREHP